MHQQTLSDAPGDVEVITAEEIRKWGYRTPAEALQYVRGFFLSSDHTYNYVGIRGFALPGDFNTRLLVLVNGRNIGDNIFNGSAGFGEDFPIDLSLVERIEVVRGASSSLYGGNGMLATINFILKSPQSMRGSVVRTETDSLGERKVQVSTAIPVAKGASLLLSGSVFNTAGASELYFPEFDTPESNFGRAMRADGSKGYQLLTNLTWGNWGSPGSCWRSG